MRIAARRPVVTKPFPLPEGDVQCWCGFLVGGRYSATCPLRTPMFGLRGTTNLVLVMDRGRYRTRNLRIRAPLFSNQGRVQHHARANC